ncbi:16044_t:CDS:2 [Cetraspora pellucida]|uniref:DNA 3'-5' helicase n=1 Tax=Cetraspora pellucida TaxID=1433469 RepID=A0A9N9NAE4_9GLOM|nr:16044_t:CDS:2 [Cetraspora pellucida]
MGIWYKNLIEQSQNRIAIKRDNNSWLVRDTSQLIVLECHKNMDPLVLKQNQVAIPSTTVGFINIDNNNFLRATVHQMFPNLYSDYHKVTQCFQKENKLKKSLQRKSKNLSTKEIQALIVKYNELVAHVYNQNRKISYLQQQVDSFKDLYKQRINSINSYQNIEKKIDQAIKDNQLDTAKKSASMAFQKCIEYIINLPDSTTLSNHFIITKQFPVRFDTSWSHCQLANQGSGEFIFQTTIPDCEELLEKLAHNYDSNKLDIFHGKITGNTRKLTLAKWMNGNTKIMIATTAFGMGINMKHVCLVIHLTFPFSITHLIQQAGRASRDQSLAKSVIMYSKNDLHTNYSILTQDQEKDIMSVSNDQKLKNIQQKLFEVTNYCIDIYRCRFQTITNYHAWPNDPVLLSCNIYDNCKRRNKEKPKKIDASEEIIELLNLVEKLTCQYSGEVIPLNIIEMFSLADNARLRKRGYKELIGERTSQKPKILKNKELVTLALSDLVVRGLVRQEIILRHPSPMAAYLTCTVVVHRINEGAKEKVQIEKWMYWRK